MIKIIYIILASLFLISCTSSPQVIVVTVVVQPTEQSITNTPAATSTVLQTPTIEPTATATPNPCLLWSQVTSDMNGQIICVRGIIQGIEIVDLGGKYESNGTTFQNVQVRWDFSANRKGFFTLSQFRGWHPETGKSIAIGDCVALTSEIKALPDGKTYIYWGTKSTMKVISGNTYYFDHPELQVFEDKAFCE